MSNLLYLVHRLPYPPNKGDKVRSFNLLKHLASNHRIFLGTFIDDPQDEAYVEKLPEFCAGMHIVRLSPRMAKIRSLTGLLTNEALTLPYYRNAGLQFWVDRTISEQKIDAAIVFSSAMAQYVQPHAKLTALVDFCDVDSAKWTQYAPTHRWPFSWIYRREGERLLAFERQVAASTAHSFFVTENETELFLQAAPECRAKVSPMCNGVDSDFFSPEHELASPYSPDDIPLVFTGGDGLLAECRCREMVCRGYSAKTIDALAELLRFYIVGRSPTQAVQELAGERVVVTGTVPDVRPYLRHGVCRSGSVGALPEASRTKCSKRWPWGCRWLSPKDAARRWTLFRKGIFFLPIA